MRKILLSLFVMSGAAIAAASAAHAAPARVLFPVAGPAAVEAVQYREEWRHRDWRRHEEFERHRRHEEWRRAHEFRHVW